MPRPARTQSDKAPSARRLVISKRFSLNYSLQALRGDLFGGITSAVIIMPRSLAFGVASGLGAAAGLYGAVVVGFFAAVCGATRVGISGPSPSMVVAMAVIVATHATNVQEALTIVIMAGLLQILLGASGIGRLLAYTPHMVTAGLLSGAGIAVALVHLIPSLGSPGASGGAMGAIGALPAAWSNASFSAVAIALTTFAIATLWRGRLAGYVPAPLAALTTGTLLGVLWLSDAPTVGQLHMERPEMMLEWPTAAFLLEALHPAIILALLGSITTLLATWATESSTGHRINSNRELVGQGIGNIVAGLTGNLPGSAGPATTLANIRAGARTRLSGVICALLILTLALTVAPYLAHIPFAALAGLMLKVGWDMIDRPLLAKIRRIQPDDLAILLLTLSLTVLVDLVTAVTAGLIIAGMIHARQLESVELGNIASTPLPKLGGQGAADEPRMGTVAFTGRFTVASSRRIVEVAGMSFDDWDVVILDFSKASYVDDSSAVAFGKLIEQARQAQTEPMVVGLRPRVRQVLESLSVLDKLPEERLVETVIEARQAARGLTKPRTPRTAGDGSGH